MYKAIGYKLFEQSFLLAIVHNLQGHIADKTKFYLL